MVNRHPASPSGVRAPRDVRRWLVVGSGGAGKSTLARRLAEVTGLPLVHLDLLFWEPGWVHPEPDAWRARLEDALAGERWVMDGNYSGTLARRLERAEGVIVLDLPRRACLSGVIRRRVAVALGTRRPDVPEGCEDRLSAEFLLWIWNYPRRSRPKIVERLAGFEGPVLRFGSRREAARFVETLARDAGS